MKEATTELLNQKRIKEILKSGGAKTVSSEAVAWIGAVAREAAKNLAASGRRTPGGRLMAPKMDPGLQARCMAREEIAGAAVAPAAATSEIVENHPDWSIYNNWQTERRSGRTKLKFEEWKEQRK